MHIHFPHTYLPIFFLLSLPPIYIFSFLSYPCSICFKVEVYSLLELFFIFHFYPTLAIGTQVLPSPSAGLLLPKFKCFPSTFFFLCYYIS